MKFINSDEEYRLGTTYRQHLINGNKQISRHCSLDMISGNIREEVFLFGGSGNGFRRMDSVRETLTRRVGIFSSPASVRYAFTDPGGLYFGVVHST
jgi:hypothetical protein